MFSVVYRGARPYALVFFRTHMAHFRTDFGSSNIGFSSPITSDTQSESAVNAAAGHRLDLLRRRSWHGDTRLAVEPPPHWIAARQEPVTGGLNLCTTTDSSETSTSSGLGRDQDGWDDVGDIARDIVIRVARVLSPASPEAGTGDSPASYVGNPHETLSAMADEGAQLASFANAQVQQRIEAALHYLERNTLPGPSNRAIAC